MRKLLVIWALGGGCGVLALVSGGSLAQTKDTIIIAVPGTPQGVDLDRQSGPQTWTMAAQVIEPGAEWKPTTYPYRADPRGGSDQDSRVHLPRLPARSRWFRALSRTAI